MQVPIDAFAERHNRFQRFGAVTLSAVEYLKIGQGVWYLVSRGVVSRVMSPTVHDPTLACSFTTPNTMPRRSSALSLWRVRHVHVGPEEDLEAIHATPSCILGTLGFSCVAWVLRSIPTALFYAYAACLALVKKGGFVGTVTHARAFSLESCVLETWPSQRLLWSLSSHSDSSHLPYPPSPGVPCLVYLLSCCSCCCDFTLAFLG